MSAKCVLLPLFHVGGYILCAETLRGAFLCQRKVAGISGVASENISVSITRIDSCVRAVLVGEYSSQEGRPTYRRVQQTALIVGGRREVGSTPLNPGVRIGRFTAVPRRFQSGFKVYRLPERMRRLYIAPGIPRCGAPLDFVALGPYHTLELLGGWSIGENSKKGGRRQQ